MFNTFLEGTDIFHLTQSLILLMSLKAMAFNSVSVKHHVVYMHHNLFFK